MNIETYRTLTINQQINLTNYFRGKKILSPHGFSIAGVSAMLPPQFRCLWFTPEMLVYVDIRRIATGLRQNKNSYLSCADVFRK